MSHVKQSIVVRKDLKMSSGKVGAQVAHAAMGALLKAGKYITTYDQDLCTVASRRFELTLFSAEHPELNQPELEQWLDGAFTKGCLAANSEEELLAIQAAAEAAGIITCLITDNGHTVFHGVPTRTCLAVGPHTEEEINKITGHLKLY